MGQSAAEAVASQKPKIAVVPGVSAAPQAIHVIAMPARFPFDQGGRTEQPFGLVTGGTYGWRSADVNRRRSGGNSNKNNAVCARRFRGAFSKKLERAYPPLSCQKGDHRICRAEALNILS